MILFNYLGFSLIVLGFIFLILSTTDLIPKQTVVTIQKIVPMKNDLNPSEKLSILKTLFCFIYYRKIQFLFHFNDSIKIIKFHRIII
jgi:hypothetical protein